VSICGESFETNSNCSQSMIELSRLDFPGGLSVSELAFHRVL